MKLKRQEVLTMISTRKCWKALRTFPSCRFLKMGFMVMRSFISETKIEK